MAIKATFIDNPQQVVTRTGDGRDLAFLTGTAGFQFKGTGGTWFHEIGMIQTPGPAWGAVFSTAATASLASVANDGHAVNEGYAVDNVLAFVGEGETIWLQVRLAVRDVDGHLHRVSYQVTVLGSIRH
jgi:hypothetical protein